jgi:chromosome segregation ATPase
MDKKELMENFKALLEEKMPEHNFSQEAVANIGRVIGDAIKSKSDQYEKELLALEEEKKSFAEAEAQMKKDLEDLRSQLQSSEDKISSLSNEIADRKSEDLFNSRMEEVDASYELTEQDRKLLVQEVQSLDNEDGSFEQYKEKLAVMWAHKSKEYIAEQEKAFQEKLEAELAKRLQEQPESKEEKTEEVESEDQVEEALANTKEEVSEVVTNNNSESSIQEPTLKEKFAQAFARENVKISL